MQELSIVPVDKIPTEVSNCPTDQLLKVYRICLQMEEICNKNDGIGLSAVQVGIPWRLFIVKRHGQYEYYLNCTYESTGKKHKVIEGCLSIKDDSGNLRYFEVDRFSEVVVTGQRLTVSSNFFLVVNEVKLKEFDLYACVFQHEIDHQAGILISSGKEVEILNRSK